MGRTPVAKMCGGRGVLESWRTETGGPNIAGPICPSAVFGLGSIGLHCYLSSLGCCSRAFPRFLLSLLGIDEAACQWRRACVSGRPLGNVTQLTVHPETLGAPAGTKSRELVLAMLSGQVNPSAVLSFSAA